MTSIAQLAMQREYLRGLLDGLGLDAYLFELEPKEGRWELILECAIQEGWETVNIPLDAETLNASCKDEKRKQRLIDELSLRLGHCKRRNET
jgi:hypothetical protein